MKRLSCTSPDFGNGDHSLVSQVLLLLLLILASTFAFRLLERTYKTVIWIASDSLYLLTFFISSITTAVLIYHRTRKDKKSTALPLSAEGSTALVARLAAAIGIDPPQVVVNPDCSDAHVTIRRGRPVVVIGQAMEWVARVQPQTVQALFAHELAHVANGDSWRGVLGRQVVLWTLFCTAIFVTGDVAVQLSIFANSAWKYKGWSWFDEAQLSYLVERITWPLSYFFCMVLAYSAFLRMREFEADAIVVRLGLGQGLKRALHQATLRQPRLLSLHPRREERVRALESDRESFRIESITMALLAMLIVFSVGLIYRSNESVLALVVLYLAYILGLFAMSLLGLDWGRKVFEDGERLRERLKIIVFFHSLFFRGPSSLQSLRECLKLIKLKYRFSCNFGRRSSLHLRYRSGW